MIPAEKVGTITYTQRDVPGRLGVAASRALGVAPAMGRLGGLSFPGDPMDLGPPVPLPGGWRELFEFLSAAGFRQVEFAGYAQHPANPGGHAEYGPDPEARAAYLDYARRLRAMLDESGLRAIGSLGFIPATWPGPDSPGGRMSAADELRFRTELEFAAILGTPYIGTGDDPTNADDRSVEAWTLGAHKWEALNRLAASAGIQAYPHNHAPAYHFLEDGPPIEVSVDRVTGAPLPAPVAARGESGKRLMEHYLDSTDPALCLVELDIYWAHVARHRYRWRFDWEGNRVEDVFEPAALVAARPERFALYHAKDGTRSGEPPGSGDGYTMVPFGDPRSDIDFRPFFPPDGPAALHNPNYEQDDAPGGDDDPGRSLRYSAMSAPNMRRLGANPV